MASLAGNSSGSGSGSGVCGSEGDLNLMNRRKRKRMESNRESARRSRLRKQKHLEDLNSEVTELQKKSAQILRSLSLTTANYVTIEAENSVLRAQMTELTQSLNYLNGILNSVNNYHNVSGACTFESEEFGDGFFSGEIWTSSGVGQQFPIMANAQIMFDY